MLNQVQESLTVDIDMSDLLSEFSFGGYMSEIDDEAKSINIDISNGPPIDIKNIKIVHYNINLILAPGKIGQLSDICQLIKIDVLILSKSKLDQTIPNNLLKISGYHEPLRHDRAINGKYGGGVLMYISENLAF